MAGRSTGSLGVIVDDLENPDVTARSEMLRTVEERVRSGTGVARQRAPMTILSRVVFGIASAFFVAVWALVMGYPRLSFTEPFYWGIVGVTFVIAFLVAHLPSGVRDDA